MAKEPLKYFLERKTFLGKIARSHRQRQLKKKYIIWQKSNSSGAMPNYGKQQIVIDYIKKFKPDVFIETGTYKGKMVYALMPYIKRIYSIELDITHWRRAEARFAGYPDIQILHGQSGEILPQLLKDIRGGCLFWLDAHYSGGSTSKGPTNTPIIQELQAILSHEDSQKHIILIDDAGCFTGQNDYPALEQLRDYILNTRKDWTFEVKNDIIRAHR